MKKLKTLFLLFISICALGAKTEVYNSTAMVTVSRAFCDSVYTQHKSNPPKYRGERISLTVSNKSSRNISVVWLTVWFFDADNKYVSFGEIVLGNVNECLYPRGSIAAKTVYCHLRARSKKVATALISTEAIYFKNGSLSVCNQTALYSRVEHKNGAWYLK